jgi:hypothetical protein
VQRERHDAVARVEGLLDAVAVVDVDVDVEHALVVLEQLEDAEHAVVHVAEARGLALLGVVQAAGPVDADVGLLAVEARGAADRARGGDLAELEEAVEDGAVLAHVEALQLAQVVLHVVRADHAQEVHVVVAVEARQVRVLRGPRGRGDREGERRRGCGRGRGRGRGRGCWETDTR